MRTPLLILTLIFLAGSSALAQQSGGDPVEITAGRTLEWHRNDNRFIAVGDVIARQGTATVYCDTLSADYRETERASMDIYRLTARGNVRLDNHDGSTAYGDVAVYTVADGKVVLTGGNLKIISPDRTITARDRMEYLTREGEARAIGDAKMVQTDDTITAHTLTAFFMPGADGSRALSRAEAHHNVVITTPEEVLTGDQGVYTASNDTAELTGAVTITSGQNILEGARASVNLTTNISTMYGGTTSPAGDGRVRGVFYPDKKSDPPAGNQSAQ